MDGGLKAKLEHRLGQGVKVREGFAGLCRNTGMNNDIRVGILESIAVFKYFVDRSLGY